MKTLNSSKINISGILKSLYNHLYETEEHLGSLCFLRRKSSDMYYELDNSADDLAMLIESFKLRNNRSKDIIDSALINLSKSVIEENEKLCRQAFSIINLHLNRSTQ